MRKVRGISISSQAPDRHSALLILTSSQRYSRAWRPGWQVLYPNWRIAIITFMCVPGCGIQFWLEEDSGSDDEKGWQTKAWALPSFIFPSPIAWVFTAIWKWMVRWTVFFLFKNDVCIHICMHVYIYIYKLHSSIGILWFCRMCLSYFPQSLCCSLHCKGCNRNLSLHFVPGLRSIDFATYIKKGIINPREWFSCILVVAAWSIDDMPVDETYLCPLIAQATYKRIKALYTHVILLISWLE